MKKLLISIILTGCMSFTYAQSSQSYGAVAIDQRTGVVDLARNYPNQNSAKRAALLNLSGKVSKCYGYCQAFTYKDSCGALAFTPTKAKNGKVGFGVAKERDNAKKIALKKCGLKTCKVVIVSCSPSKYMDVIPYVIDAVKGE